MAEAIPQHPSCSMDEAGRSELAVTTVTTTSTTTTTTNKRAGTDTDVQLCDPANAGASLRTGNGHAQPRTGAETSIPSMVHPAETKQQATASLKRQTQLHCAKKHYSPTHRRMPRPALPARARANHNNTNCMARAPPTARATARTHHPTILQQTQYKAATVASFALRTARK